MADLLEQLLAAETAVWEAMIAGDAAADRVALADEFLGVTPAGFAGAEAHAAAVAAGPAVARYRLSEARAMALGADHGLLAYRADYALPDGEEAAMYVASVWRRSGEGWLNVFSQDTPVSDQRVP